MKTFNLELESHALPDKGTKSFVAAAAVTSDAGSADIGLPFDSASFAWTRMPDAFISEWYPVESGLAGMFTIAGVLLAIF